MKSAILILCFFYMSMQGLNVSAQMSRFDWQDYELKSPARHISSRMQAPGDTTRVFKQYNGWPSNENYEYDFEVDQGVVKMIYWEENNNKTEVELKFDHEGFNSSFCYVSGDIRSEETIERLPKGKVRVRIADESGLMSDIVYKTDAFYRYVSEEVIKAADDDISRHKRSFAIDSLEQVVVTDSTFNLSDNKLAEVSINSWNSKGRLTRSFDQLLDPYERMDDHTYTFNEAGQLLHYCYKSKMVYENIEDEVYRYNEQQEVAERIYRVNNELKSTLTFTYTFDEKGNWIEKHIFLNGIEDCVVKRTIRYE